MMATILKSIFADIFVPCEQTKYFYIIYIISNNIVTDNKVLQIRYYQPQLKK